MTDPNPFEVTKRKPLTPKQRVEMFLAHGGICCLCHTKIMTPHERWIDEHELALWLGGGNEMANRGPAHERCAKAKTSKEATERSHIRRVAEHHMGAKRPSKAMPGSRRSGWKHKMDGSWERRDG